MTIDKIRLKKLAEEATQGPWCWDKGEDPRPHTYGIATDADPECMVVNQYFGIEMKEDAYFIAAASPSTVLALLADIERLERESEQAKADGADAFGLAQGRADMIDQLKAENEALRKEAELLALGRAKLAGAMSRLRAKHNDWTSPEALPAAELVWCACGDGFPPNSYGAGFMDANNGVCWSCDAAKAVSHD